MTTHWYISMEKPWKKLASDPTKTNQLTKSFSIEIVLEIAYTPLQFSERGPPNNCAIAYYTDQSKSGIASWHTYLFY